MANVSEQRRSGFSSGTEEPRWRGKPSLLSTTYFWIISVIAAFFISQQVESLAAFLGGKGLRFLLDSSGRQVIGWLPLAIWLVILWPVFSRTMSLLATTYEITNQRIIIRSGILVRTHDQVEMFRIRDFMLDAPLFLNILGLSHIRVISRDESLPLLTLFAQPQGPALVDLIRFETQRRKDEVGVREIETGTL
jgi:membrane protein YdbS with pleckstrin-like domain